MVVPAELAVECLLMVLPVELLVELLLMVKLMMRDLRTSSSVVRTPSFPVLLLLLGGFCY